MSPSPRERMIHSAPPLFRERGIAATALADVLEHSGAPRGSLYHYFPGGKAQLQATRYAGQFLAASSPPGWRPATRSPPSAPSSPTGRVSCARAPTRPVARSWPRP